MKSILEKNHHYFGTLNPIKPIKIDPYRYHKLFLKDFTVENYYTPFAILPNEILYLIFMELGVYHLFARLVCKRWCSIIALNERYVDNQAKFLLYHNDFHCLKYIALNDYLLPITSTWCESLSQKLGETGSLEDLIWFEKYGYKIISLNFTCGLAKRGDTLKCIEMLEYAKSNNLLDKTDQVYQFITNGNLELLKWFLREKFPVNAKICESAAIHGQLFMLQ